MDKKNDSESHNITKKQSSGRIYHIGRYMIKWYKRERSNSRIEEKRWSIIEIKWNCSCEQTNLYSK